MPDDSNDTSARERRSNEPSSFEPGAPGESHPSGWEAAALGWDRRWQETARRLEGDRHEGAAGSPSRLPARQVRQPHRRTSGKAPAPADLTGSYGRVVLASRGHYQVATGNQVAHAVLAGAMRRRNEVDNDTALPVVGDWVGIRSADEDPAVIECVLERRSVLERKSAGTTSSRQLLAANIDSVFIVMGLDRDFNLRRLERYLLMVRSGGAEPIVVLNKLDLAEDLMEQRLSVQETASGAAVVPICALDGRGVAALGLYVDTGKTVALVGSSGAGKSTLVNRLMGREVMRTGSVRSTDERGRHTTSHRELIVLSGGGVLIDTPGLRELQLWVDDEAVLEDAFDDISRRATSCRFRDCQHVAEPGCAVLEAVALGDLDAGRFESYRRLQREIASLERRRDEAARRQAERRQGKEYKRIQSSIRRRKRGG